MKEKMNLYLWLAGINLFISSFTFGGGYVVVPMVKKYYVHRKNLFTEEELMEMAAIAQSSPGAIAVNLTALAGYRAAGVTGLVLSCVCAVIPPIVILAFVSVCYSAVISNTMAAAVLKGMQAGAAALIVDFIVDMTGVIVKKRSGLLMLLTAASFAVSYFSSINVIFVLLASSAICALHIYFKKRRE